MENRYEIRKPINNIEFIKGIKLEKKIFNNSSANYFLENIHFSNAVIIKDCLKNKIVGFLIHVNRNAIILNVKQKVSFVSSVCIHPDYRNKGLSKGLIKESLNQLKKNKVSIAFVIARKKVDYFYNKFGYFGISSFPKIILEKFTYINNFNYYPIKSFSVTREDLLLINRFYLNTYKKLDGFFFRNKIYWEYLIKKCKKDNFLFKKFVINNKTIGYAVFKKNEIIEIACKKIEYYNHLLNKIREKNKSNNITIYTNNEHDINISLVDQDLKYCTRRIYYGGHLAKIINSSVLIKTYNKSSKIKKLLNNSLFQNEENLIKYIFSSKNKISKGLNRLNDQDFYIRYLDQI